MPCAPPHIDSSVSRPRNWHLGCLGACLLALLAAPARAETPGLRPARLIVVARMRLGDTSGAEIVSVQPRTARAVVALPAHGQVALIDVRNAHRPRWIARHALRLKRHEVMTSVAFHPTEKAYFVAVESTRPRSRGRVHVYDAATGRRIGSHAVGVGPDSIVINRQGTFAVVANEAEEYVFNRTRMGFESSEGGVSILDLRAGLAQIRARTLTLRDQSEKAGVPTPTDKRVLIRSVDLDGDARLTRQEREVELGLDNHGPGNLEPEGVAFSPDGTRCYVTLQENNMLLTLDPARARILSMRGLGVTEHAADVTDDGTVAFDATLRAFREPDGVAVTPDGRYVITADEGDTGPSVEETGPSFTAGGGRTISIFDAHTGVLVADTGDQLDQRAHQAGVYPDSRSGQRGSEPESVVCFACEGRTYAAVALERANAVALVDISDPELPAVRSVTALPPGSVGPEGLAVLQRKGRIHLFVANEVSGDLVVLHFRCR